MSCFFTLAGRDVWNPSNSVGRLFHAQALQMGQVFGIRTGLGAFVDDECHVDAVDFRRFIGDAVTRYERSAHPVLRSMTEPVTVVGLVLLQRADLSVPEAGANWACRKSSMARGMTWGGAASYG